MQADRCFYFAPISQKGDWATGASKFIEELAALAEQKIVTHTDYSTLRPKLLMKGWHMLAAEVTSQVTVHFAQYSSEHWKSRRAVLYCWRGADTTPNPKSDLEWNEDVAALRLPHSFRLVTLMLPLPTSWGLAYLAPVMPQALGRDIAETCLLGFRVKAYMSLLIKRCLRSLGGT